MAIYFLLSETSERPIIFTIPLAIILIVLFLLLTKLIILPSDPQRLIVYLLLQLLNPIPLHFDNWY